VIVNPRSLTAAGARNAGMDHITCGRINDAAGVTTRRSPFAGHGFIQTSSYLLPRALGRGLRFRTDTPHDDWDYLLGLSKQEAVRVETAPEILVTLYAEDTRPSLSKSGTWLASLQWAERGCDPC
jgi:hypothetical protein